MAVLRPAEIFFSFCSFAVVAAAALLLMNEENFGPQRADYISWIIFAVAFVATKWLKVHPILMIVVAAVLGLFIY